MSFLSVALRLYIHASKEKVNQQTQSSERAESQQQNSKIYRQTPMVFSFREVLKLQNGDFKHGRND